MPTRHHSLLIGHGAVVFILGLVAGVPFLWALDAIAAGGGAVEAESLRAWRMAHLEGTLNGMMMIAVAAAVWLRPSCEAPPPPPPPAPAPPRRTVSGPARQSGPAD